MKNTEDSNPIGINTDQDSSNRGKKKNRTPDQMGSSEFYQGEKIIEDITLPGEKKIIKAETVKRAEIYEDKLKNHEAFIASLGRKMETSEKSGQEQSEYVEEKRAPGKKIILSLFVIIVLGGLMGGGYWHWAKKQKTVPDETSKQVVVPIEVPVQDNSDEKQPEPEKTPVEEIKPSEVKIKVLNEGAPAGSAGKNKDFLVSKGYTKTEAGNGELDSASSFIYYNGEKFKSAAEDIKEALAGNKVQASVKEALTSEQKSADIVVVLGKI